MFKKGNPFNRSEKTEKPQDLQRRDSSTRTDRHVLYTTTKSQFISFTDRMAGTRKLYEIYVKSVGTGGWLSRQIIAKPESHDLHSTMVTWKRTGQTEELAIRMKKKIYNFTEVTI